MTDSVSSTGLSGIWMLPKIEQLKSTRDENDRPSECRGWGRVEERLVLWVLSSKAPRTVSFTLPNGWSQGVGGISAMERTVHVETNLVSHDRLKKQLSTMLKGRGSVASLPGCKVMFCYFLAAPSWATSEPLFLMCKAGTVVALSQACCQDQMSFCKVLKAEPDI